MNDRTFTMGDHDEAAELIAGGVNPYNFDEARGAGVEYIPEGRDIEISVMPDGGRVIRTNLPKRDNKYRSFYDAGRTLMDLPLDTASAAKITLLKTCFRKFGRGGSQDLDARDYAPAEIGRLFKGMFDYAKKRVERSN